MNTINLAIMSLHKKAIITILIVMELAVLFFIENYTVCSIEERTMLLAPYSSILGDDSLFIYDTNYFDKTFDDPNLTFRKSQNVLLEGLEGNYKLYNFLICSNPSYSDYTIYSVDDELYNSLAMPLTSGSYGSKENSAVASPGVDKGELKIENDKFTLDLEVCGNLTSSTYVPESTRCSSDLTANDLYTVDNSGNVIITGRSCLGEAEKYFQCSFGFIVKFDSPEAAKAGMNYFNSKATAMSGSIIKNNTNKIISEDLKGFIPILSCILFIVLIGLISISVMIFDENKYRNGVLWLCGYSRKRITVIQAVSIGVLLLASLAVFAVLAIAMNFLISNGTIDSDSFIKISFGWGNIIITLLTCIVLIGASTAMPAVRTFKKSPVEYLGRAK